MVTYTVRVYYVFPYYITCKMFKKKKGLKERTNLF